MDLDAAREAWGLDPSVTFLNHGSFGACPRSVLDAQQRWREQMERQPVDFLDRRLHGLLAEVRERVAAFLDADAEGSVFVPNATAANATVLAHANLRAGDNVVITDHAYPSLVHAALRASEAAGAHLRIVPVPLPFPPPGEVAATILDGVDERTRLVVVDQVASPTGAIFPVEAVVEGCRTRGAPVLVDGAHAPGQVPVRLRALAPDFWSGNLHKWVCAPKGAALLWIAEQHRDRLRPLVTSHAYLRTLHERFDWTGTHDPTPILAVPAALDFFEAIGWERVRAHNHSLAEEARAVVAAAVGSTVLVPPERFGSMAMVALPEGLATTRDDARALGARLYERTRIEVPFVPWNGRGYLRLSAQIYNRIEQYERLAAVLPRFL